MKTRAASPGYRGSKGPAAGSHFKLNLPAAPPLSRRHKEERKVIPYLCCTSSCKRSAWPRCAVCDRPVHIFPRRSVCLGTVGQGKVGSIMTQTCPSRYHSMYISSESIIFHPALPTSIKDKVAAMSGICGGHLSFNTLRKDQKPTASFFLACS